MPRLLPAPGRRGPRRCAVLLGATALWGMTVGGIAIGGAAMAGVAVLSVPATAWAQADASAFRTAAPAPAGDDGTDWGEGAPASSPVASPAATARGVRTAALDPASLEMRSVSYAPDPASLAMRSAPSAPV
ncbi:hypothetical protein K1W68_13150, partial [Novacetimonas hansenii]|nr:hypothetical protein [Novacetimonas hansenii]